MQGRFGFLYGKTFMDNSDIDRWLAVNEFSVSISKAVEAHEPITDVTILALCERILNENLNSDTICGVSREVLSKSAASLRASIEDFKFKPNWVRENFPAVWKSVKYMMDDNAHVIIPVQMGRFIQVLKFISNIEDNGAGKVTVCDIDQNGSGHATVTFSDLILNGSAATNELFGRMRFCDAIGITTNNGCVEVSLSVSNLVMSKEEFYSRNRPKRAWVLQWNQVLKSNLNEGDGQIDGTEV